MNFKKTMLASLLMISASGAFAASSADLKITGSIAPSSCNVTLAGGDIDLGNISRDDLNETSPTALASHEVTYNIVCDAAGSVKHSWVDSKSGTGIESPTGANRYLFGFGLQGSARIGGYSIQLRTGVTSETGTLLGNLESNDNGGGWSFVSGDQSATPAYIYSFGADGNRVPVPVTTATSKLTIVPYIAPSRDLDLTDTLPIEGVATMSVSYL